MKLSGNLCAIIYIPTYNNNRGHRTDSNAAEPSSSPSSNLYLSNLSPDVTEDALLAHFGPCGPIASVKILPHRQDDTRNRLCGFVCFMAPNDADRAVSELNASILLGNPVRISIGRPVSLPSAPLYGLTEEERSP
jgi:RNA recognition motif-containing protein